MNKENKENYQQKMHCENCGHNYTKVFEFGTRCSGSNHCPNCGCLSATAEGLPDFDKIRMSDNQRY